MLQLHCPAIRPVGLAMTALFQKEDGTLKISQRSILKLASRNAAGTRLKI
jgi:hypothetical protein